MNVYNQYFAYYSELEKAFLETENYVAIDQANYNTYSVKYMWLLQSVCSEIDTLFKTIARVAEYTECYDMSKYYMFAEEYIPTLKNNTVEVLLRNLVLNPFSEWKRQKHLSWWNAYNGLKHDREKVNLQGVANYQRANLENVLNAMAALYLLENYRIVFDENDNDKGARKMLDARGELFVCTEWKRFYQSNLGQKLFPYDKFVLWIRNNGVKCW